MSKIEGKIFKILRYLTFIPHLCIILLNFVPTDVYALFWSILIPFTFGGLACAMGVMQSDWTLIEKKILQEETIYLS